MISREEFRALLSARTLLLDGGYGASFFEMGHRGVPERLNIEHPEAVLALHRAYVAAGADLLLTNTFGGNRHKLSESGLFGRFREINRRAVQLARCAADEAARQVLVFGDMSSTGNLPKPSGSGSFSDCRDVFREQAELLLEADCDGIIIETLTDIKEMRAAVIAVRELSADIPLIAHMAFDERGLTLTGASVEVAASVLSDLDVDVIGMNCLVGPEAMLANLRRLAAATNHFLSVEPNAGDPYFDGERTIYVTTPLEFSLCIEEFVEAGASIIGGCCGTGPEHIRAAAALIAKATKPRRSLTAPCRLASRTLVHDLDEFTVIGERINPTGKAVLRDAMRGCDWQFVATEAIAQADEGAQVIDINFGVERFFTEEMVSDAFIALDRAVRSPLSLDIQTLELMEAALREYPGRPLINSSACDEASLRLKLPLLKKYGGMMILLALDGDIAETAEERMAAVDRALAMAAEYGIGPERFLIDPLALAIGSGYDHRVSLQVIRLASARGLRTTIGLSNLSHGMPMRSGINAAWLSQAVEAGLSSAIMNSGDGVVVDSLFGALLLKTGVLRTGNQGHEESSPLVEALLSGKERVVNKLVDEQLAEGLPPLDVSQNFLGGAMEEIGRLYESKKIFLPHILFAAETAFPIFDRLNLMAGDSAPTKGRVMLATVEGDIHDIGKNIVGTVLRAGGFEVFDIGKNKSADEIAEEALRLKPDIVGLSAMMTTTVGRIPEVVRALREKGISLPTITGGASMNPELAALFGVYYSQDSVGALSLATSLARRDAN